MNFIEEDLGATLRETERANSYDRLYHYTSVEGLKGILDNESLWTTQIQYMNDSKEFSHAVDIAFQIIKRKKYNAEEGLLKYYEAMEHSLKSSNGARTFIFSMTENPDQLSQWRGYCGLGGYSIGFNKSSIVKLAASQGYRLEKCLYDDAEKAKIIEKVIDESVVFFNSLALVSDHKKAVHDSKFYGHFLRIGSIMKHSSFSEENEWRLIGGPFSWKNPPSRWRTKDGLLLPYYEFYLNRDEDGFLPISEVYIGPCREQKLASDSLRVYMQVTGNMFRMRYSKTPYRG
ncbi:MAG: DUF2971 domain-containing protein [Neptuniibacter sp.]